MCSTKMYWNFVAHSPFRSSCVASTSDSFRIPISEVDLFLVITQCLCEMKSWGKSCARFAFHVATVWKWLFAKVDFHIQSHSSHAIHASNRKWSNHLFFLQSSLPSIYWTEDNSDNSKLVLSWKMMCMRMKLMCLCALVSDINTFSIWVFHDSFRLGIWEFSALIYYSQIDIYDAKNEENRIFMTIFLHKNSYTCVHFIGNFDIFTWICILYYM